MPAAGSKGAPKNPGELKDDTSSAREEKQVKNFLSFWYVYKLKPECVWMWTPACIQLKPIVVLPLWIKISFKEEDLQQQ